MNILPDVTYIRRCRDCAEPVCVHVSMCTCTSTFMLFMCMCAPLAVDANLRACVCLLYLFVYMSTKVGVFLSSVLSYKCICERSINVCFLKDDVRYTDELIMQMNKLMVYICHAMCIC